MRRITTSIGLAAVSSGLVVAAGMASSGAQTFTPTLSVVGSAECQLASGYESWDVRWEITNTSTQETTSTTSTLVVPNSAGGLEAMTPQAVAPGTITVLWGDLSGVWTSHFEMPGGVELLPGDSFVLSSWVPNSAVGQVTGSFTWSGSDPGEFVSSDSVTLDGSCTAGVASETVAATPVVAQPTATG